MDTLPLFEFHKICRICLKTDLLVSIFSPTFLVRPIEMIEKLNIFKYAFDDGLPTLICQPCLYRLLDAYNLKQLSESSENRLRDYLRNIGGVGNCSLDLSAGVGTLNKIMNNSESSCFSSSSANSTQHAEDPDSVGIYENIYHMFEKTTSNDIEVEDEVINDVVIDVSSLTRSEAEENTVSDIAVDNSAVERDIFNDSRKIQAKDDGVTTGHVEKRLQKNTTKALKTPDKCLECGNTFSYSGYLEVHMRIHTGEKPFHCKMCQKSFTQSGNLLQHMRTHSGQRQFQCEMCSRFFTTSSNLKAHTMTHKERREFACQQCTLLFKTQRDLKKHEPIHKVTKDITCTLCRKTFSKSSYLSAHMSAVHRSNRKHTCPECNRSFGSRSNLVCHLRTHNGEKPFHCKYCTWKFSQSSALARHMKKHSGERCQNSVPEISNEELINDCLKNSKLPNDLIVTREPPSLESQNALPNISGLSQLNTQLMEVSGGDFAFSATSSLHAYDFTKENILDFSTNQQTPQSEEAVY